MTDTPRRSETTEADDWATIRELLKAGCSLPDRLQKMHDRHMRKVRESVVLGMKGTVHGRE